MTSPDSERRSDEVPPQHAEEPTVGQPLNAPERRPFGRVLILTVAFFAVLVLLYIAALEFLVD